MSVPSCPPRAGPREGPARNRASWLLWLGVGCPVSQSPRTGHEVAAVPDAGPWELNTQGEPRCAPTPSLAPEVVTPSCLTAMADRSLGDTCFSLQAPVALWQRLCLFLGVGWGFRVGGKAVSAGLQGPGLLRRPQTVLKETRVGKDAQHSTHAGRGLLPSLSEERRAADSGSGERRHC